MKYVIVPAVVSLINKRTGTSVMVVRDTGAASQPWTISMDDFVSDNICGHPKLSAGGGEGLRRQRKLLAAFEGSAPGDVVAIEDADYVVVRAVIGLLEWSPQFAPFASQLLPHVEAWEQAEKQDDVWKKKHDAEQRASVTAIK